ncbi:MAG TPA: KpsF/GutQ family sugar-phosphate isomerase [Rhodospirillaceae bacterium]|jgi:arabinose-5-phosphate isomerase|nr:KpsF/GutQ family sugar-phosphate isomerase [Alphaproteobacteria bacterium]HBH26955.1 KpsF/GutQ family sugar-phosphate isomerase [Rhodospirillaceae bacterium]
MAYLMRGALETEARAVAAFAASVGIQTLEAAVQAIDAAPGPLIVAGIGKSGHIARKIASTFSSLGRPAIFLHAAEASHGDLGLVQKGSIVLLLSHSGETTELSDLLAYCTHHRIDIIALTGRADSTLACAAKIAITYGAVDEVCPNGLAPTTSTTLALAIGDALAVGLAASRGAAPEDFRRYHPGGKLGARLMKVADLMLTGACVPTVAPDAPMEDVVIVMTAKTLGAAILAEGGRPVGIITDGDLRRHAGGLLAARARDIATPDPVCIGPEMMVSEAVTLMTDRRISACPVTSPEGALVGALGLHEGLRAGVVVGSGREP